MLKNTIRFLILLIIPLAVFAATAKQPTFLEGQQYKVVSNVKQPTKEKQVIEFFNYGCPACNHFEPALEAWLKNKPKDVEFSRVPVVFEAGWQVYARTYYVAQALGVANKMAPYIFSAIHEQNLQLSSQQKMATFFAKHGVAEKDFINAYNYSPQVQINIGRGQALARKYQIKMIPTVIVNGRYETNLAMAKGSGEEMVEIIQYLLNKD